MWNPSATERQALRRAVQQAKSLAAEQRMRMPASEVIGVKGWFLGGIVDHGPDNEPDGPPDYPYWVQRLQVINDSGSHDEPLSVEPRLLTDQSFRKDIVRAANIAEAARAIQPRDGSVVVQVFWSVDKSDPRLTRYWFDRPAVAAGSAFPIIITQVYAGSPPSYPIVYTASKWLDGAPIPLTDFLAHNYAETRYAAVIIESYQPMRVNDIVLAWWENNNQRYGFWAFGDFDEFCAV